MADEAEQEDDAPAVELGEGVAVGGAPVARVASRLTWGIEMSEVRRREGDTEVRTVDGPRPLGDVLDDIDETYFESRQAFEGAVCDVIGYGPAATEE